MEKQPGERLILSLEALRTRLNSSGVERTKGLFDAMGDDCNFFRKSLDLFLDRDYEDILTFLKAAIAEYGQKE